MSSNERNSVFLESEECDILIQDMDKPDHPVRCAIESLFVISLMMTIAWGFIYFAETSSYPLGRPDQAWGTESVAIADIIPWDITASREGGTPLSPAEEQPADDGEPGSDDGGTWGEKLTSVVQWWVDSFDEWFGIAL